MVNIRVAAAAGSVELYTDGWHPSDISVVTPVIIEAACDELWHHLEREPGSFTLTVRCAISTALLSIRCGSPEWTQQLNAALATRVVAYLRENAKRVTADAATLDAAAADAAAPDEAFQVMRRRPPVVPPVRKRAEAPRRALSAENAADLYNEHRRAGGPAAAAINMLRAAAALLGEDTRSEDTRSEDTRGEDTRGEAPDRALRERLEQKLWEASVDGLIADDQKKQVEEIRKYLLDPANK